MELDSDDEDEDSQTQANSSSPIISDLSENTFSKRAFTTTEGTMHRNIQ